MPKRKSSSSLFRFEVAVSAVVLSFFSWVVLSIFSVQKAVAVIETEQIIDKKVNDQVLHMSETLIRIDENVKYLRADFNKRDTEELK